MLKVNLLIEKPYLYDHARVYIKLMLKKQRGEELTKKESHLFFIARRALVEKSLVNLRIGTPTEADMNFCKLAAC